ncbi:MAG: acyltransferase, partial [Gemmatimonadales bacterium]|nr:acyltransferase [Gemmatimonadales bacterium]
MRSGETSFRTDIEGLRGIAVLLVVLYHAGVPGMSGGFTGVDVFFVLSGYLITELLVKEVERTGRVNFLNFYARRARRLLPAAVLVLAVTLLASALVFAPVARLRFVKSAIATALYVSNFQFLRETADYFGDNISSDPFLHTWSLAVEEQFYLVWPVLVALGLGARASRGRVARVVGVVALASFVACVWYTWHSKPTAFFASPPRAWEFGLGGLAALLPAAALRTRPAVARALGWVGLALILIAGCSLTGNMLFPGPLAIVPVLGTVAALMAGAGAGGEGVGRVLAVAPLQSLGRLSYSWYLWHWPVLVLAAEAIPGLSLAGRLLCAAGALGLAAATYVTVEHPIRTHAHLLPRPWLSLKLAGGLSVVALALALGSRGYARAAAAAPRHQAITAAATDRSALYRTECLWVQPNEAPRECVFGDSLSTTVVVLLGDSHAAHWFPAVQRMAEERRWRLVAILKPGCPPADVPVYDLLAGRQTENCRDWRRYAIARVATIRPTAV